MSAIIENNVPLLKIACNTCKHLNRENFNPECSAFERIPKEIGLGENMHRTPLPGQGNDIVYEPEN